MSTEIELSLSLSPSQNAEFKRKVAKLLPQASKPVEQPLVSIYYDTPALDLAKRRMGLRLRQQGNQWIQTVKFGQKGGGLVFGDVAGLELRDDHRGDAVARQRGDLGGGEAVAFSETAVAMRHAMRENGAFGLQRGDGAELHRAPARKVSTIWARIETAISPGERALMASPTGPRIRLTASSLNPAAARRARRAAWVFREPSAPT